MIAPDAGVLAPRTNPRRISVVVATFLILLPVAAWMFFPSLTIPRERLVGWQLKGYGGPGFNPTTAQTTGVVRVFVASWPIEYRPGDDSWLATPDISYAPLSVTITLHTSDSYDTRGEVTRGWYDTGGWVDVQLIMPLGGRVLFDGSRLLPEPRLP